MCKEQFDDLEGYCRQLGHTIPFKYCRTQQNGIPCSKLRDCYFERIPIQDFIDNNFSAEEKHAMVSVRPPKLQSILELIEKAKKQSGNNRL
ncbi:hypothetical protein KJ966_07405 [bacterium]|nr:hypothetical protein [bacterium]